MTSLFHPQGYNDMSGLPSIQQFHRSNSASAGGGGGAYPSTSPPALNGAPPGGGGGGGGGGSNSDNMAPPTSSQSQTGKTLGEALQSVSDVTGAWRGRSSTRGT